MSRTAIAIGIGGLILLIGQWAATTFIAEVFHHQSALGRPLHVFGAPLYAPWMINDWARAWGEQYPRPFAVAGLMQAAGLLLGCIAAAIAWRGKKGVKPFGQNAWAGFSDARAAGLFAETGAVLGKLHGETLCFDGPEHQILIGASRSGKGRGHVVPTLLAWPSSALVLDVKGELADGDCRVGFPGTAGFRERIGPVLRFAPTRMDSISFNPLSEVRRGANEVRDVQNIVEILVDPVGDGWSQSQVRYYIFALLFVVFDVEAVFIFPWATQLERYGTFGLVEMGIFVFVLLLGLVYAWRKGVLRWV